MSYGTHNTECMNLTISEILRNTNFTLADIIIWKKSNALPNNVSKNKLTRICEFIYVFCRKSEFKTFRMNKRIRSYGKSGQPYYENIYNFITAKNNDGSCNLNKATFSTELVSKLLNLYSTNENDVILDPFMGTGTTAVACIKMNRKYIGFELSKGQCDYALQRIDDVIKGGDCFNEIQLC